MKKLLPILLLVILIGSYYYFMGLITYDIIDKSDDNLGITSENNTYDYDNSNNDTTNNDTTNDPSKDDIKIKHKVNIDGSIDVETIDRPSKYDLKLKELLNRELLDLSYRDDLFHIVLLGVDSRNPSDNKGRSDALLIVTLDTKSSEIRMTSIPRDLLILRNEQLDKLTHAYAYGRGESTLRVLNSNFQLDIREYAAVTMFDMNYILSLFEPISIEISEDERKEINYRIKEYDGFLTGESYLDISDEEYKEKNNSILLSSGMLDLNSDQLLAYMRIRKIDSDVNRTNRQKIVLTKLINKTKTMSVSEIVDISTKVLPKIVTSMDKSGINKVLVELMKSKNELTIKSNTFPSYSNLEGIMLNGVYYSDVIDRDKLIVDMNKYIQSIGE